MAKVKITGHASGTGILTVTAPNTSTDRTITLPDATGTLLNSDGSGASLTALNATQLTSGTVPDARFPATLPAASGVNLTALNATQLTSGTVPTARLGSGTADSTVHLRGDGTWAAAGGDNTPAFLATMSAAQSVANDTEVKIAFDTEAFDTDSAYDHSTNYRFTVPSGEGGKYFISFSLRAGTPADTKKDVVWIRKNGSGEVSPTWWGGISPGGGQDLSIGWAGVIELAAADYIEVYTLHQSGSTETYGNGNSQGCHFAGYKLIGI